MIGPQHTVTADIVPFPAAARRPRRSAAEAPRGAVLLFTGVRYERLPDPAPVPAEPPPSPGRRKRG